MLGQLEALPSIVGHPWDAYIFMLIGFILGMFVMLIVEVARMVANIHAAKNYMKETNRHEDQIRADAVSARM